MVLKGVWPDLTTGQIILMKGRIVVLSPLAAANRIDMFDLDPMLPLAHRIQSPKRHLDRFSRFCVQRSKLSQCFSVGGQPPKLPFPLGGSGPNLTRFLGPIRVSPPPPTASLLVQPFLQGSRTATDRLTDTQTDRPSYSACSNRRLMRPKRWMKSSEIGVGDIYPTGVSMRWGNI